jgi:hypothetical protein
MRPSYAAGHWIAYLHFLIEQWGIRGKMNAIPE